MVDGFWQASWNRGSQQFTCGFEVRLGLVRDPAPVLGWARGKPALTLRRWVEGKGGQVRLIADQLSLP